MKRGKYQTTMRRTILVLLAAVALPAAFATATDFLPTLRNASGVQGVDWDFGPGPNEITLYTLPRDVCIEAYIANFEPMPGAPYPLFVYQVILDCKYEGAVDQPLSLGGSVRPKELVCPAGAIPLTTTNCYGIDTTRPDWIMAGGFGVPHVCGAPEQCPDELTGRNGCGDVAFGGTTGYSGMPEYAATFCYTASATASGQFALGLSEHPDHTMLWDGAENPLLPYNFGPPVVVTIAHGRCCYNLSSETGECATSMFEHECEALPGPRVWARGESCAGDWDMDGKDDSCESGAPLAESSDGLWAFPESCWADSECRSITSFDQAYCIPAANGPGTCYMQKNRWISFIPSPLNVNWPTALRIAVDRNNNMMYDAGIDTIIGWAGEPFAGAIGTGEPGPLAVSRAVSVPHFTDWTAVQSTLGTATATLHVGDCEISPGWTYLVQSIGQSDSLADENAYSQSIALKTADVWGDVIGYIVKDASSPSNQVANMADVLGIIKGFQHQQQASRVRLDLSGEIPEFHGVNFADVLQAIRAFQGNPYPFRDPCIGCVRSCIDNNDCAAPTTCSAGFCTSNPCP